MCFKKKIKAIGKESVIQLIAKKVYLKENETYPCVDLTVKKITLENRILIDDNIAGFKPRKFGKGWSDLNLLYQFGYKMIVNKYVLIFASLRLIYLH